MYKELSDIPNPYNPFNSIKDEKFFIGRTQEIKSILRSINNSSKSGIKKDFILLGDKSIGKSSLLNILTNKLQSANYLVVNFTISETKLTSPLDFFRELYDEILIAGSSNDFLNRKMDNEEYTQKEIWEGLTLYGEHSSTKNHRKLFFPELFARSKHSQQINHIPESHLISDFKYFQNEASKSNFENLIIIFDEFQLLENSSPILNLVMRLMEELSSTVFILSGNYLLKSETFYKIKRHSEIIEIEPFSLNDIHDLLYKPMMNYGFTREEIAEKIDKESFKYVLRQKEYNPYYINLLMYYAFEKFKDNKYNKLRLDNDIIAEVMNQLKYISHLHERISAQLNACTFEQLSALQKLFRFQEINLNDLVLLNLHFKEFSNDEYQKCLSDILTDLSLIDKTNLFSISGLTDSIDNLLKKDNISNNEAAEIVFHFSGDNIDELYMAHIISSSLNQDIVLSSHKDIISWFSHFFSVYILDKALNLLEGNRHDSGIIQGGIQIPNKDNENLLSANHLEKTINLLSEKSKLVSIDDKDYTEIQESLKETSLYRLPLLAADIGENCSFSYLFVKARIRHKHVYFEYFIPCSSAVSDTVPTYLTDLFMGDNLTYFNVEVIEAILIPINPEIVVFLHTIDTLDLDVMLMRNVYNGSYKKAIEILEIQKHFSNDFNITQNNLGFVYIQLNDLEIAKRYFNTIKNKETVNFVNLAYIEYLSDNFQGSDSILKKAAKLIKSPKKERIEFRVINQILLPANKQKTQSENSSLIYRAGCELVILGNRGILASLQKQSHGINILREATIITELDHFYHQRYEYYILFNTEQFDKARVSFDKAKSFFPSDSFKDLIEELYEMDKNVLWS